MPHTVQWLRPATHVHVNRPVALTDGVLVQGYNYEIYDASYDGFRVNPSWTTRTQQLVTWEHVLDGDLTFRSLDPDGVYHPLDDLAIYERIPANDVTQYVRVRWSLDPAMPAPGTYNRVSFRWRVFYGNDRTAELIYPGTDTTIDPGASDLPTYGGAPRFIPWGQANVLLDEVPVNPQLEDLLRSYRTGTVSRSTILEALDIHGASAELREQLALAATDPDYFVPAAETEEPEALTQETAQPGDLSAERLTAWQRLRG
jgi:hypothetical protein